MQFISRIALFLVFILIAAVSCQHHDTTNGAIGIASGFAGGPQDVSVSSGVPPSTDSESATPSTTGGHTGATSRGNRMSLGMSTGEAVACVGLLFSVLLGVFAL
jgi:hypothetical protein